MLASILTNRSGFWQVALVISLFCSLMAGIGAVRVPVSSEHFAWISSTVVVLCSLPAFLAWMRVRGAKVGALSLCILAIYALMIEAFALIYGFPYGRFIYLGALSGEVFGAVPWTVPFAWVPLMMTSYGLAQRYSAKRGWRWLLAVLILVTMDLVLDPGAVALGIWRYDAGGWWYGVPWTNFAGWCLTGGLALALITRWNERLPWWASVGVWCLLAFWLGVAVTRGLWLVGCVAVILSTATIYGYRVAQMRCSLNRSASLLV